MTDLIPAPQEPQEKAVAQWQGVKSDAFEMSSMSYAFHAVLYELRQRDPKNIHRKWHDNVALWAAWEGHKGYGKGKELLEKLGLPKTQKGLAELMGINVRTLRGYARKHREIASIARAEGVDKILAEYEVEVLHTLGLMASFGSPKTAADRRLYMEVMGHTGRKGANKEVGDKDNPVHIVGMTLAQWQDKQARLKAERDTVTAETIDIFEGDDETP